MPIRNQSERWGVPSIFLHWLTVLLVLGLLVVGLVMTELPNSAFKVKVYALHKSIGLTVLGLTVLRLLWRLFAGTPAPVPGTPRWQNALTQMTHGFLYVMLLMMLLSGWLYISYFFFPLKYLGWFNVTILSVRDDGLNPLIFIINTWSYILLILVILRHPATVFYPLYRYR